MKVIGNLVQPVEVEISRDQLAWLIWNEAISVLKLPKDFDDAGCDWITDGKGSVYIADEHWFVGYNPYASALIDAMNIVRYSYPLGLKYTLPLTKSE
jgi:hypothetical protein